MTHLQIAISNRRTSSNIPNRFYSGLFRKTKPKKKPINLQVYLQVQRVARGEKGRNEVIFDPGMGLVPLENLGVFTCLPPTPSSLAATLVKLKSRPTANPLYSCANFLINRSILGVSQGYIILI